MTTKGVAFTKTRTSAPANNGQQKQGVGMLMKAASQGRMDESDAMDQEILVKCLHCGSLHKLANWTNLMDAQLGKLLVQVKLEEAHEGEMQLQSRHSPGREALKRTGCTWIHA